MRRFRLDRGDGIPQELIQGGVRSHRALAERPERCGALLGRRDLGEVARGLLIGEDPRHERGPVRGVLAVELLVQRLRLRAHLHPAGEQAAVRRGEVV